MLSNDNDPISFDRYLGGHARQVAHNVQDNHAALNVVKEETIPSDLDEVLEEHDGHHDDTVAGDCHILSDQRDSNDWSSRQTRVNLERVS